MAPLPIRDFKDVAEMERFYSELAKRLRPGSEPLSPGPTKPAKKPATEQRSNPLPPPPPPPPPPLQRASDLRELPRLVARAFGIPENMLLGNSRRPVCTLPRHFCFALAYHLTTATTTKIGLEFGRDHSSVHNAISRLKWLIAELNEGLPAAASLYEWVETGSQILQRKDEQEHGEQRRLRAKKRRELERMRNRRARMEAAANRMQMVRDADAGCGKRTMLAMPALEHTDRARSSFSEAHDRSAVAATAVES